MSSRTGREAHPRGYIYFAIAFSLGVEIINMRIRKRRATALEAKREEQG